MIKILLAIFFTSLFSAFAFGLESKPSRILDEPKLILTEEQSENKIEAQGAITLRVEFLADGQIGKILPVNSLLNWLTDNAVEAAKKIKFEPEIKDNKPTTILRQIQYSFNWNDGWRNAPNQFEDNKKSSFKIDEKAEAVLKKAVEKLGGEKYLQVKSIVGRGRFSLLRDNAVVSFQSFIDVIVYPDRERTEFKGGGLKTVQTNTGDTGWIFESSSEIINVQTKDQIENFKRGIRTSIDNLLRGYWRGKANLTYIGKRPATIGKRSEVVKLTFEDGFAVEFEFSDEYLPIKAVYKRTSVDNEEVKEEDRYAQFVDVQGIKTPFIIDHFSNGAQTSRVNYESIEFNKIVSDTIFAKPNSPKELKKDLKL